MEQDPINNLELAIMELEFKRTTHELTRIIPSINPIFAQRLTYFLVETRRAAFAQAGQSITLRQVLAYFHVTYMTYYDWRFKWYHLLPSNVKKWLN